jgi:hypothetical protein
MLKLRKAEMKARHGAKKVVEEPSEKTIEIEENKESPIEESVVSTYQRQ